LPENEKSGIIMIVPGRIVAAATEKERGLRYNIPQDIDQEKVLNHDEI
jgi:hypothetical protein